MKQQHLTMQEILEKVEFLFKHYSLERRATTQPYLLQVVQQEVKGYRYNPESNIVRESIIEHVGSLPMLATALYPFIDDPEVDLGKALTMLAIHDIGELVIHDEITFTKKSGDNATERESAFKLLDPMYHDMYDEAEAKASKSAQFAKSIDKINPDILDYLTPADITKQRYKHFLGIEEPAEILAMIVKHKRPPMLWNPFMTELHTYLMNQFAKKLGA